MRVLISGRSALVFIREEEWGTSRGASALSRRCDYGGVRAEMGPILLPVDIRQRLLGPDSHRGSCGSRAAALEFNPSSLSLSFNQI
ncbi:unnamed protein product [Boreogadus saida]